MDINEKFDLILEKLSKIDKIDAIDERLQRVEISLKSMIKSLTLFLLN